MSRTAEAESHAVLPYGGVPTLRTRQPSTITPSPLVMDERETSTSKNFTAQPSPSAMPSPDPEQQGTPASSSLVALAAMLHENGNRMVNRGAPSPAVDLVKVARHLHPAAADEPLPSKLRPATQHITIVVMPHVHKDLYGTSQMCIRFVADPIHTAGDLMSQGLYTSPRHTSHPPFSCRDSRAIPRLPIGNPSPHREGLAYDEVVESRRYTPLDYPTPSASLYL